MTAALILLLLNSQTHATEIAENVDTSGWLCDFCVYPKGWFGMLDIGPGYASDSSLKFADYRGIEDKDGFISLNGDIHYLDQNGKYFDLYARHLGLDSRQLEMRAGHQGRLELRLSYREIPRYLGYGTQTPHQGVGGDQLVLPPDWVKAQTTSGMSALDTSLSSSTLAMKRKIFEAGLSFKMSGKWQYDVDFQRTEKNGSRSFGAGVLTSQSSHFPAPVDFSINRIDMGLEYSGKTSRLRLGFSTSSFSNRYSAVSWENPFIPLGNTGLLRAALEPDSANYQLNLTGSFRPTSRVRISARAGVGRIKQNDSYIPYSSNPDFEDLQLPRTSLDGKLNTTNLAARLTARLSPRLNLSLRAKYDDRENRTAVDIYTPVITDLVKRPETYSRPYSFTRSQYSAELFYRTYSSVSFNAGVKQKDYKRTLQSVRETNDTTWWGGMSIDRWSTAQLRIRLESSHRDISPYRQINDPGLKENILMRKFSLADRDRDRAVIELDLSPGDRLSASLSYFIARDRYQQSILGLMESNENSLSLDLGITLNTKLSLQAFVSIENYDSDISGTFSTVAAAWSGNSEDRFTSWGVGLIGMISDKLDVRIDYFSSDARGRIITNSGAGEPAFPELGTELRNARIGLDYQASRRWGLKLLAEHESYDSSDWQIDGLGNDGINAILSLGPISPDYSITLLRLLANYTF